MIVLRGQLLQGLFTKCTALRLSSMRRSFTGTRSVSAAMKGVGGHPPGTIDASTGRKVGRKLTFGPKGAGRTFSYDSTTARLNQDCMTKLNVDWVASWSANPYTFGEHGDVDLDNSAKWNVPQGVQYVPMVWSSQDWTISRWSGSYTGVDLARDTAQDLKYGKSGIILGFNEPDGNGNGQSNMNAAYAADNWYRLEKTGMRLGSPAPASRADQDGSWLEQFFTELKRVNNGQDGRVDFVCIHWYGYDVWQKAMQTNSPVDVDAAVKELVNYVTNTYNKYKQRPIWLTEFALINYLESGPPNGKIYFPSDAQQADFVTKSRAALDALPFVERYAWFSLPGFGLAGANNHLIDNGGNLTAAGRAYAA